MSPADLSGATANIVTLEAIVTGGKNTSLVYGYNGTITSALHLHTRLSPTSNIAQVAAFFSTCAPNLGLFNGMLFNDMVAKGISFPSSTFQVCAPNRGHGNENGKNFFWVKFF